MKTDINKPYLEWCDRASGSVKELSELGQTAAQEFVSHYIKQTNAVLDFGKGKAPVLWAAKDIESALSAQKNFVTEWQTLLVEHTEQTLDLINQQRERFTGWWTDGASYWKDAFIQPYIPLAGKKTA
ncbi:MAG: hypothetical protein ACRED0_10915 [Gammaproteobacteria bacterium]